MQCRISISIKVIRDHFSLALTVVQILALHILWPWKRRSRSRCTTFAMTPSDGKYMICYLISIIMFVLSLAIYERCARQIKCRKFELENIGQGQAEEKLNFCHSTGNVWFHIGIFFRILAIRQHKYTQTWTHFHTHTHTHTHTYTHTHTHTHIYTNTYTYIPTHIHRPTHTHTHTHSGRGYG